MPAPIGGNGWIGSGVQILPGVTIGDNSVLAAYRICRFLRRFAPQKPRLLGFCELLVRWQFLHGKKSPLSRFLEILCAKRDKLLGAESVVTNDIPANVVAFGVPRRVVREIGEKDKNIFKDRALDVWE
ncbi:MAG: hypothetical protein LBD58_04285 [Treponema sp.]|jgi:carbonic anhydrase/acetyltransferase-like protein (isoleucine patch superfamily)|nr:hypothetical protein [Treponema sp.]